MQQPTSNDIGFLDLEVRSRSHVKVKGHRRGGVCVLWMLLVLFVLIYALWHSLMLICDSSIKLNWPMYLIDMRSKTSCILYKHEALINMGLYEYITATTSKKTISIWQKLTNSTNNIGTHCHCHNYHNHHRNYHRHDWLYLCKRRSKIQCHQFNEK